MREWRAKLSPCPGARALSRHGHIPHGSPCMLKGHARGVSFSRSQVEDERERVVSQACPSFIAWSASHSVQCAWDGVGPFCTPEDQERLSRSSAPQRTCEAET
jgi:hypothetical protein